MCPCGEGEGDCDSDRDCKPGLHCVANVGAKYKVDPTMDVCERAGAVPDAKISNPDQHAVREQLVAKSDLKLQRDSKPVILDKTVPKNNGPSWSLNDPPVLDRNKALGYCENAKKKFLNATTLAKYQSLLSLADLNALYQFQQVFRGMTEVYEVTGDTQVLSALFDLALRIVAAGEDMNKDGYLDYCFRDPETGKPKARYPEEPPCDSDINLDVTYPWRALMGPAQTLRALAGTQLAKDRSADFEKLRQFVYHDVIDKWLDLDGSGADKAVNWSNTTCIDSRMADILTDYYMATGDPKIGEMARQWSFWVATDMDPSTQKSGAYYMRGVLYENYKGWPDDTAHNNQTVAALINAFEAGFIPYSFIEPLQSTYLDIIWNGDLSNPLFYWYPDARKNEDGTISLYPETVAEGFILLGQFKGKAQTLAEHVQYRQSYIYEYIMTNGNLCKIFGLAKTEYPLAPKGTRAPVSQGSGRIPGASGKVTCGSSACNLGQGQKCCTAAATGGQPYCSTSCPRTTLTCDGPEDCNGKACCGAFRHGFACNDMTTECPDMRMQLCHSKADCPASHPHCCGEGFGLPGLPFGVCSAFQTGACN